MKTIAAIIATLLLVQISVAQEVPTRTQQQLENAAEATEDEAQKDDNYLQQLDFFSKHPINLNTATAEDLHPLRMLSDLQIQNIIQYRTKLGNFIDMYELQAVPTLDLVTIRQIQPYVFVGPSVTTREALLSRFRGGDKTLLARLTRVLEHQKGYDTSLRTHYLGSPNQIMVRYRYQYKDLLMYGIVADKDAGEQFFKGAQKQGFDFYSAHFFARKLGKIKALAAGDFLVNFGQGLIQWQSSAFGKSAEVMSVKRQSSVLMPYRSAGEFFFYRGAGVTFQNKNVEVTAFGSFKKFSGNSVVDTIERFSSFQTSGFYRTPSEVADRYNLNDVAFGGNVSYQTAAVKVGWNAVAHNFSSPLQKRLEPYNYFAASGKRMLNTSVDYSFTYRNIHVFGEAAADKDLNKAFVSGALMSVDPKVDLFFLYRNISAKYQAFYGNAFTENTLPSNETGFYTGIAVRPSIGWQLSAYADFYHFPFIKYRVDAPTRGADYLLQVSYVPSKKSEIFIRYRNENKPLNESGINTVFNYPVDKVRQNLRLHYAVQVHPIITLKTRLEILWYDQKAKSAEEGFLSYIEASFKPSYNLSGNVRLQYFETGGYNSRIYVYESDVLYSFSIPAFFDNGFRYYANINYDVSKHVSFWLRIAQTMYNDKSVIGSGLDEITGNRKTDLKLQAQWRF